MKIGYARVSKQDQNLDLQLDALTKYGCEQIYQDKASGARTDRQGLEDALKQLRKGDILVVWRLDRLGRSISHLISIMKSLEDRGISFACVTEAFDTSTPNGKLVFHLFSALAEFERSLIKERTRAGLEAARARGKLGGRPIKMQQKTMDRLFELYDGRTIAINELCAMFKISKTTLYEYLKMRNKSTI